MKEMYWNVFKPKKKNYSSLLNGLVHKQYFGFPRLSWLIYEVLPDSADSHRTF